MLPTEPTFSAAETSRYSRHLLLPEIGLAGQQKLKAARVLVVGCGGLGCLQPFRFHWSCIRVLLAPLEQPGSGAKNRSSPYRS